MRRITSFLVGAVMGGLVGTTLAMLLAPYSGKEMRAQMQARAQQLRDDLNAAAAARRAELEQQLAVLRSPRVPPEA
jgi:gas vesicle protein